MKHLKYENWIMNQEILTNLHQDELENHLHVCADCTAFAEADRVVHLFLAEARQAAPLPGFRARFEKRLAEKRTAQYKRQVTITLALSALLALLLGAGVLVGFLMLLLSSDNLMFEAFANYFRVLQVMVLFGSAGKALLGSFSQLFDPSFGYTMAAGAAGLCLIWLSSLYGIRSYHRKRE